LILTSIVQISFCQNRIIQSFIPENFGLLDSASGDFNQDGKRDIILILKSDKIQLRPLLILIGSLNGQFILSARNDSVVLCGGYGGLCCDPYSGITIKKQYLSIEHYGGDNNVRWTRIITFKFDRTTNQFILHKDATVFTNRSEDPKSAEYVANHKENFDKLLFKKYSNGE
jgi:ribosomal protein L33